MSQPFADPQSSAKRYESVQAACKRLGVSQSILWKLLRTEKLTRHKLGRRTLIDPAELDALIAASCQPSKGKKPTG